MSAQKFPALLLGAALVFLTAFFLVPMMVVLVASLHDKAGGLSITQYAKVLADGYHLGVVLTTFRISLLTTLLCVVLAYPLAWYLVRIVQWRWWRRACVILLVIPLFTSNIVRSFGWIVLLGRNGLVNDVAVALGLADRPMRILGTETAILVGMVYVLLPLAVLGIGNALLKVNRELESASDDLGATPLRTFLHITFPLTLPGIVASAVMVFTLATSAYVTPALLSGGRVTVLSMLIFQQYSATFDFAFGGALSIVLLALTLVLVSVANRFGKVHT
jgi:putative spermidine/putrescine transport system permease protein